MMKSLPCFEAEVMHHIVVQENRASEYHNVVGKLLHKKGGSTAHTKKQAVQLMGGFVQ